MGGQASYSDAVDSRFSQIVLYYDESNTRRLRRFEILARSAQCFSARGWEAPTMSEIAQLLGMERRTLYSYYNNKMDLVVDSFLQAAEFFSSENPAKMRENLEKTRQLPLKERLSAILRSNAANLLAAHPGNQLVLSYDEFIMHLAPDSPTFKRFLLIRRKVATHISILSGIISEGEARGEIGCATATPEELAVIMEQAFRAYVLKIAQRRHYTDHYRVENLDVYIPILVHGLLSAYPPKSTQG